MTQYTGPQDKTHSDDPYALWDGAYVLGALSGDQRQEYEAHLSGCAHCRAAVAELNDIPKVLGMLDPREAAVIDDGQPEPPPLRPQVLDELLGKISWRRRRSRLVVAAVASAAAVILAIGVLIGTRPEIVGLQREEPAPAQVALDQVVPSPVQASIALTSHDWGTGIDMTCTYGSYTDRDAGARELRMVLVDREGKTTTAATWTGQPNTSMALDASTSLPVDQIASVQVVSADTNQVLLQRNL